MSITGPASALPAIAVLSELHACGFFALLDAHDPFWVPAGLWVCRMRFKIPLPMWLAISDGQPSLNVSEIPFEFS